MTIDETLIEWRSKKRTMGCVSASEWFCKRVNGFRLERLDRYTKTGEYYGHTVCTNGVVRIDLSPYNDSPDDMAH